MTKQTKNLQIIGLMSGTSLDGLDVAHVQFHFEETISFEVLHATTYPFPDDWKQRLKAATDISVPEYLKLDKDLGHFHSELVSQFLEENKIPKSEIAAIASHGHTIFHQPERGFTSQISCGKVLAFELSIPVINDFRTLDVVAGGQGAPLVPIGDELLFNHLANAFLNLGGFCNVSFDKNGTRCAFDIAPCNLPLNRLVAKLGLSYDEGGKIAATGKLDLPVFDELNALPFYTQSSAKSLGTEWLDKEFMPLLSELSVEDSLRTVTEHVAFQIARTLNENNLKSCLVTGGGTYNSFLLARLQDHYPGEIVVPKKEWIDFKEAIIFAFLGARFLRDEINSLASVTGAKMDLIGGTWHKPGY